MEVPRYWRTQKIRYGNGEGKLRLAVCPVCGEKIFPPNRPICTACNSLMKEEIAFRSNAVGVGALTFVATDDGLKLLLFNQVDSNLSDDESQKKERVIYPKNNHVNSVEQANHSLSRVEKDFFTRPKGINTVTGKVDNDQSSVVLDFLKNSENFDSLSFEQLPPTFVTALFTSMLREIEEEVPGLSASELEDKVHFFSKSSFNIEQIRPIDKTSDKRALFDFTVFVLAILIEEGDLTEINREGWHLYSPQELSLIDQKEFRKATLAVLDFLPAALLFLAEAGKIPQEELAVLMSEKKQN